MPLDIEKTKQLIGWLSSKEISFLYDYALKAPAGNMLELGTYCGKSACVLGQALRDKGSGSLICIDRFPKDSTFRYWYDDLEEEPTLIEDTLEMTWENLEEFGLSEIVTTFRGDHEELLKNLKGYFSLVYIDGGHKVERVLKDARYAYQNSKEGAYLVFHDYGKDEMSGVTQAVDQLCVEWGSPIVARESSMVVLQPK